MTTGAFVGMMLDGGAMIRWMGLATSAFLVAGGCGGDKCPADKQIEAWVDADGDGFGGEVASGICDLADGFAGVGGDCDDNSAAINPEGTESCNGLDDDCDGDLDNGLQRSEYFVDADADGFGDMNIESFEACDVAQGASWATEGGDCDDVNPAANPGIREICNDGVDDDCDGVADDDDESIDESTYTTWHQDADGDGFGRSAGITIDACAMPSGAVEDATDCDDNKPEVNPTAQEICNAIDDDCDDARDDLDDSLDPAGQVELNADVDGDTFGDPDSLVMACGPIPGVAANDALDCDDNNEYVNPGLNETTCDGFDNDCDPETPDDGDQDEDGYLLCADSDCRDQDPLIYPGATEISGDGVDQDCDGFENCFEDLDGDGSRTDVPVAVADPDCLTTGDYVPESYPIDCDDSDDTITWSGRWERDDDGDGYGDGITAILDCIDDPGFGYILAESGDEDCNDDDAAISPGAIDACNDGLDADCDTVDTCASCSAWHDSDPLLASGIYNIRPSGDAEIDIYCDMTTDDGGWTLVASSALGTLNDQGSGYYDDLTTIDPIEPHPGIWSGMSTLIGESNSDVRFACKTLVTDLNFTVDLSFYDVPWYSEFASGSDASVCFTEDANPDPTPARRNNLLGTFLDTTDPYDNGSLVGEDDCLDTSDFTVDFSDAGMDGDADDGTDWGEDDGKEKCGVANAGEAWFVFIRERPPL